VRGFVKEVLKAYSYALSWVIKRGAEVREALDARGRATVKLAAKVYAWLRDLTVKWQCTFSEAVYELLRIGDLPADAYAKLAELSERLNMEPRHVIATILRDYAPDAPAVAKLREVADRLGLSPSEVLVKALGLFDIRAPKSWKVHTEAFDKAAYYAFKVSQSIAWFKREPTESNYSKLIKTLRQLSKRYGVRIGSVSKLAEKYKDTGSREVLIDLNMATKELIKEVFEKILW